MPTETNPLDMRDGYKLVHSDQFDKLGISSDECVLFGCCTEKNTEFNCSIDFTKPKKTTIQCSCSTTQLPCRHVLGLVYAFVQMPYSFLKMPLPGAVIFERERSTQCARKAREISNKASEKFDKNKNSLTLKHKRMGYQRNSRFIKHAAAAAHSPPGKGADFCATVLVPRYGKTILLLLITCFDPSKGKEGRRVLSAIHGCDPVFGATLAKQLIDPKAKRVVKLNNERVRGEVFNRAILCLGETQLELKILHSHLSGKKKAARICAHRALIKHEDALAIELLDHLFHGSETMILEAIEVIPDLSNPLHQVIVLKRGHHYIDAAFNHDLRSKDRVKLDRILKLVCNSNIDQNSYDFLLRMRSKVELFLQPDNVTTIRRCIKTVLRTFPELGDFRTDIPIVFHRYPENAIRFMLENYGPEQTLTILSSAEADDKMYAINCLFNFIPDYTRFAPPQEWPVEWVKIALSQEASGPLTYYLMKGLPTQVLKHILTKLPTLSVENIIFALTLDPSSASRILKKKFEFKGHYKTVVVKLCKSIDQGDLAKAQIQLASLRDHPWQLPQWLDDCEKALNESLGERLATSSIMDKRAVNQN